MEAVFMSVATTPGWIAAKVNPSSGVTSDAQLSVTAAAQQWLVPDLFNMHVSTSATRPVMQCRCYDFEVSHLRHLHS
jgi:hypothetical protein